MTCSLIAVTHLPHILPRNANVCLASTFPPAHCSHLTFIDRLSVSFHADGRDCYSNRRYQDPVGQKTADKNGQRHCRRHVLHPLRTGIKKKAKSAADCTIQSVKSAGNDRTRANNITKAIMRGKRGDRTVRPSNNSPTTNEPRQ